MHTDRSCTAKLPSPCSRILFSPQGRCSSPKNIRTGSNQPKSPPFSSRQDYTSHVTSTTPTYSLQPITQIHNLTRSRNANHCTQDVQCNQTNENYGAVPCHHPHQTTTPHSGPQELRPYRRFWNHTLICFGSMFAKMGLSLISWCRRIELGFGHSWYTRSNASTCSFVYRTYFPDASIVCSFQDSTCHTSKIHSVRLSNNHAHLTKQTQRQLDECIEPHYSTPSTGAEQKVLTIRYQM